MINAKLNYPIHNKEMLAIVAGFAHWRAHLAGIGPDPIQVLSDHKALEYFMTTKALSARQARWAETLSQFNFQIMYRTGTQNRADALTRRDQDLKDQIARKIALRTQTLLKPSQLDPQIIKELEQPLLTTVNKLEAVATLCPIVGLAPDLGLIDNLLKTNREASSLQELRQKADNNCDGWTIDKGLLKYQDRLVVAEDDNLRTQLIQEAHAQVSMAHPGKTKTRKVIGDRYYWPRMTTDIDRYIRNCSTCRRTTVPRDKTPGLLKPLPIPDRPWQHVSMDFHEMPPDRDGYDTVMVIVDRLGKRAFSIPCKKTITAKETAECFIDRVYRIYGPPDTIVSDRGPQFISAFWKEFTGILGIKLKLSTAYHPQTDGQTEIMNQYLDQRLRPFVNHHQDNWAKLLPMMDYAQATLPHESTGMAPIQLEMGYLPRTSFDWTPADEPKTVRERLSREEAQQYAKRLEETWQLAKESIKKTQKAMETQANKQRREPDFDVEDLVWITTKNWKTDRPSRKLGYQMAGPYKILKRVGNAYQLELPESVRVHPIFSPDKLHKAANNLLPGQQEEPPLLIQVNGNNK